MIIYTINGEVLTEVKEKPFALEIELQRLFERNLILVTGLIMVKSEFTIKNKRIDTLAFDEQTKAFSIIEYKRQRNSGVADQGMAYLNLMLENKSEFIMEYNESLHKNLKRSDIDWSQSRVLFVSTGFTENQIQATNFKDFGIELWEVKQFENGTVSIKPIKKSASAPDMQPILNTKEAFAEVVKEIKVYSEQDILAKGSDISVELYEKFKDAILNLADDIEVRPLKHYVGFRLNKKPIADIEILKKGLVMTINRRKGQLDDSKGLTSDVSEKGHLGNGDYIIRMQDDKDIEYIMSLVKQVV
jgi:predicted transport protein